MSTSTEITAAAVARGERPFLGRCVVRPLRRSGASDFVTATGVDLILANVGQILATKGDSHVGPGELPWRTEFGSKIHLLRHKRNAVLARELARVWVEEALERWEPRADVTSVEVTRRPRGIDIVVKLRVQGADEERTVSVPLGEDR